MEPPQPKVSALLSKQSTGFHYSKPSWSALPMSELFSLEVIKNGTIVEDIPLKGREYFRIGRQPDIVDIPMEHASISRVHAILNFHSDGSLHIFDNRSANGTFVNKMRISSQQYVKLKVGDVIKFGESTRIIVLKGPEEVRPDDEEQEEEQKLRQLQAIVKAKMNEENQDNEITWGMREDAEEVADDEGEDSAMSSSPSLKFQNGKVVFQGSKIFDENEDERFRSGDGGIRGNRMNLPAYLREDESYDRKYGSKFEVEFDETQIKSDKDRELADKLRKKERKIQNMQEEIRRIYLKEHQQEEGLTAGQLAVVARNDKGIADLIQEANDLLKRLNQKQIDRNFTQKSDSNNNVTENRKRPRMEDNDDDTSDLYDTSSATADISTNWRLKKKLGKLSTTVQDILNVGAPADSLKSHLVQSHSLSFKEIKQSMDTHSQHMLQLEANMKECQKELSSAIETDNTDELSIIIAQNQSRELKAKLAQLEVEHKEAALKMTHLQKLMQITAPAFKSTERPNPSAIVPLDASVTLETKEVASIENSKKALTSDAFARREELHENPLKHMDVYMQESESSDEINRTDIKSLDPVFTDHSPLGDVKSAVSPISKEKGPQKFQNQMSTDSIARPVNIKSLSRPPPIASDEDFSKITSDAVRNGIISRNQVLQGGEMMWAPPKQQKGDGKTSLNAKLGY